MQTARGHGATLAMLASMLILALAGAASVVAAPPGQTTTRPFPSGRVIGTSYFGPNLDWHDPVVQQEILQADVLVLGDVLAVSQSYAGFVDQMHASKPTMKILQTVIVPWIFDTCNSPNPPGSYPCEDLGRRIYDLVYPQHIARVAPVNPNPAVGDTAFMTYGTYMIDIDDPGVAEAIADIVYDHVMTGYNQQIDGVNLDFFASDFGEWAIYGNSPGELGYTGQWNHYWVDMDRDGIGSHFDADERMAVCDAYGRFVNRLRLRFGAEFIIAGNGGDALWNATMSNGQQFYDLLDIRQRELFPWGWSSNDYFLPAFDIAPNSSYGGQNVWELANHGRHHPAIQTPQGSYMFVDTLNGPNGPWICLSAMMLDNGIAYIGGDNMDEGRTHWWQGDPMPLLDTLGNATAAPVRNGNIWSRQFAHGSIHLDFTNAPAELYIEPYTGGDINAPNGPFKYLVLGASVADTLYRGGGWPRAVPTTVPVVLVNAVDFESTSWSTAFGGGNPYVARVANEPHDGGRSLRGNLKPGLQDPIAQVAGNADPNLRYDGAGALRALDGDAFLRYWWRWDNFNWNGPTLGCGTTVALVDATSNQPALTLTLGYVPRPGRGGPSGGELEISLSSTLQAWGQQHWGDTVARLGSNAGPPLLPLDNDWHEVEILLDHGEGTLAIWIDGTRLEGRPGDAHAAMYYPDGHVPLPSTFKWSAVKFAAALATQVSTSTNAQGYAAGYQIDDIELFNGYQADPGAPGRPVVSNF